MNVCKKRTKGKWKDKNKGTELKIFRNEEWKRSFGVRRKRKRNNKSWENVQIKGKKDFLKTIISCFFLCDLLSFSFFFLFFALYFRGFERASQRPETVFLSSLPVYFKDNTFKTAFRSISEKISNYLSFFERFQVAFFCFIQTAREFKFERA